MKASDGSAQVFGEADVTVGDSDVEGLEIPLRPAVNVRVTSNCGMKLANEQGTLCGDLTLYRPDGRQINLTRYHATAVPAGWYDFEASASGMYVDSVLVAGQPVRPGQKLHIDEGMDPVVVNFFAGGGERHPQALEEGQGQTAAGLAVGAGAFVDPALVVQCKEGLDLANHLAAGAFGVEDLIEKTEEGASHRINTLPAVGACVSLGEHPGGQLRLNQLFQVGQALWSHLLDPLAQSGQPGPEGGKEGGMHRPVYILV